MDLGQRIKEARLEKGLSQRELCGSMITRNMLSLIENGSARPSMDTLLHLARQLEKPVSYFLEEAVVSPNQELILQARNLPAERAVIALKDYQTPDPIFDPEYYLIIALSFIEMARQALEEDRRLMAVKYLEQAGRAGEQTPYYTPELELRRVALCYQAKAAPLEELAYYLPDIEPALIVQAHAALEEKAYDRCGALLEAVENRDEFWHFLRGESYFGQKEYTLAAEHYLKAETRDPAMIYFRLEECYRELGDYEKAYNYIRKQR